jgi:hypothetical protein
MYKMRICFGVNIFFCCIAKQRTLTDTHTHAGPMYTHTHVHTQQQQPIKNTHRT